MANKKLEFFAGGNTPQGFFSYYDYIANHQTINQYLCIKGGPGTGKSTLMKKAAAYFAESADVEIFHCSSDPDSLDGVAVPSLGFAVVDGTSPHIVDPKIPGAIGDIFHAGLFWNADQIRKHKAEIVNLTNQISLGYEQAYFNLSLIGKVEERLQLLDQRCRKPGSLNPIFRNMTADLCGVGQELVSEPPKPRKLFLSAITPSGIVDYSNKMMEQANEVFVIKSQFRSAGAPLMTKLDAYLRDRGIHTTLFYSPLFPSSQIEHIYAKEIDTFFTTQQETAPSQYYNAADLDEEIDIKLAQKVTDEMNMLTELKESYLNQTIDILTSNKSIHDQLETNYIPYIDFEGLSEAFMKLLPKV